MYTQLFQTQMSSQVAKNDGNKRVGVLVFIDELLNQAKKFTSKRFDEKWKKNIITAMSKMANEPNRIAKVHQYFRLPEVQQDRGLKLSQFIEAWSIIATMMNEEMSEKLREQQLLELLTTVETYEFSFSAFLTILNEVKKEAMLVSTKTLLNLFEVIDLCIQANKPVGKRWREIVMIIVKQISMQPSLIRKESSISGLTFLRERLSKWLALTTNPTLFDHAVFIAKELELHDLYLECFQRIETDLEKILSEKENNEQISIEVVSASWKTLFLTQYIPDTNKKHFAMLSLVAQSWPIKDSANENLLPLLKCCNFLLIDNLSIGKTFLSIFKSRCSTVLRSEFAFLTIVMMCGIDRYKATAIQELKRALSKAFKFDEESYKIGWLKLATGGSIADDAKVQMKALATRMTDRENWDLLATGTISLCYSLFDLTHSQKVLVCDGKAASVPDLWAQASILLAETIGRSGNHLSDLLIPLVSTIAIHSNSTNVSAAIVLIDTLVEVVQNCTIEVLNNYKQIEGVFEWVCRMRRDIAVSLIRSLLPIINQRPQLRQSLFSALKRDLLNSGSVASAVPLLLSLLQSISNRRTVKLSQGEMSQSFATFSSQSLEKMGLAREIDETLGLEIVGVLKRCLAQPARTRAAFYHGITDVVHRNVQISGPCLELLLSHSNTLPQWSPKEMIISSKTVTEIREALPQLIQAIESLTCSAISSIQAGFTQSQGGGDILVRKAEALLSGWVDIAIEKDTHELEIDKLSEWNPNTPEGRSSLLFSHLMLAVYDVLMEFLWRRYDSDTEVAGTELDRFIAVIRRRNELLEVLNEKTVRRKEEKVTAGPVGMANGDTKGPLLNFNQVEVDVSGRIISQILDQLLKIKEDDKLWEIKIDLLDWTITSSLKWSGPLRKGELPLHSNNLRQTHLINIAKHFLGIYVADEADSPAWIREIPMASETKSGSIEVYSDIVRYCLLKYRNKIIECVAPIWGDERTAGGEAGVLARHGVYLLNRVYIALVVEKPNVDGVRKKGFSEFEKQAKMITKLVNCLLEVAVRSSPRASHIFVKTYWDILEQNEFASIQVLRDTLNAFAETASRVTVNTAVSSIFKRTMSIADSIYERYTGEDDANGGPLCVVKSHGVAFVEFIILMLEKSMVGVKEVVSYIAEFVDREQWDQIFVQIVQRLETCTELMRKLMQLHNDVAVFKEKITATLTTFYSTFEITIKLLLDNAKSLKGRLDSWKSIEALSSLLKGEFHALLAECDENVGEIEKEKNLSTATKFVKTRREENLYVKYAKARESLQATILRTSIALEENRLDFQVKKNSIGTRDFRLNLKKFMERAKENAEESADVTNDEIDTTSSSTQRRSLNKQNENGILETQKRGAVKEEPISPGEPEKENHRGQIIELEVDAPPRKKNRQTE